MGNLRVHIKDQKGVVFILVVITLVVLIAFAALALDVGNALVVRNEVQNIADAAALAGARTLGRLYECNGNLTTCTGAMPYQNQLTYVADAAAINQAISNVASLNQAGGKSNITINSADIVIGNWDSTNKDVNPITLTSPDAVRVTARRDASANGPITTFFAGLLGINSMDVSATATAALTGQSTAGPGGLPLPIGIPSYRFTLPYCQQDIKFYPTGSLEGCAGWHVYTERNANKPTEQMILQGLAHDPPTYISPATTAYQSAFGFTGGVIANLFDDMYALYDFWRTRDDDGNPNTWTTSVVVFDQNDCSNPNQTKTIVGFATVTIWKVTGPSVPPPNNSSVKEIIATIKCDNVETGRGSGGNYGTKGSIPGLVQ
jgi:hypothetical protein